MFYAHTCDSHWNNIVVFSTSLFLVLSAPEGMSYAKDWFLFFEMFMILCGMVMWTIRDSVDGSTLCFFPLITACVCISVPFCAFTPQQTERGRSQRSSLEFIVFDQFVPGWSSGLMKHFSYLSQHYRWCYSYQPDGFSDSGNVGYM